LAVSALIIAGIGSALSAFASVHACADDRIAPVSPTVDLGDYFANWFTRVDEAQATQPHWKAPLTTTTPLLTELVSDRIPAGERTNWCEAFQHQCLGDHPTIAWGIGWGTSTSRQL